MYAVIKAEMEFNRFKCVLCIHGKNTKSFFIFNVLRSIIDPSLCNSLPIKSISI